MLSTCRPLPARAILLPAFLLVIAACGCGSQLKYRVVGPVGEKDHAVGPLRIEVTPIDTAELEKGHPFRWRGSKTAGFMLFDVKITNTDDERDLLCLVGHLDFPGRVSPKLTTGNFLESSMRAMETAGESDLIGTDDLELTDLAHELATILMEDGYRYQVLNYHDFSERYCLLMQKEMRRAGGLAFIPYIGGFIASSKMRDAAERRPERLIQAQQKVMRPGVVPAGRRVRGFLVFTWPSDTQPGRMTLRLPVQPGHADSFDFDIVRID
jgi:hypothetical protein